MKYKLISFFMYASSYVRVCVRVCMCDWYERKLTLIQYNSFIYTNIKKRIKKSALFFQIK